MILKLNDDYRIESDEKNFILQKKRTIEKGNNTGDIAWDNLGYYGNKIDWAIAGCLKHGLMKSEVEGLEIIRDYLYRFTADVVDKMELLQSEVEE